ncbi:MAG: TldD/PmbA family protein, partial [Maricaulaceae bacterium]
PGCTERLPPVRAPANPAGAAAGAAAAAESRALSVSVREGALEDIENAESYDVGLRVFIGRRQAGAASSDISEAALMALAERVVAMAKLAPEDPYCGLAPDDALAQSQPDLDLVDPTGYDAQALEAEALALDAAAQAVPGVWKTEGAGASWSASARAVVTSAGFQGAAMSTGWSRQVSAVAKDDSGGMERDYDYARARHRADLRDIEAIGREAGERAVARLNPRKPESGRMAVLFEPRVANDLLGAFLSAISGPAVARGVSFLKDKMGAQVFAAGTRIEETPHRPRGLACRPFDAEGVAVKARALVDEGRLTTWLLNAASARQLSLPPTGHATGGFGGPPGAGASNVHWIPGARTPEAMIADLKRGVLITETFGASINPNTGDYSVGASGLWIENGEKAYPVSEMTVAGNLLDMFARAEPASDLEFRYAVNAPTLLIDNLAVSGQ